MRRCQKLEERFTPGRDLGAQTGFKMGAGSQLTSIVRQRLEVAAIRAIDQLFSWNEVEQVDADHSGSITASELIQ